MKQKGWPLTRRNYDHWGSFKIQGAVAFGAGLTNTRRPSLYFKVSREVAAQPHVEGYGAGRYYDRYRFVEYEVEGASVSLMPFAEALDAAFALRRR